jgi:cilia- and flagella-associated protein 300
MAAFEEVPPYEFTALADAGMPCLESREAKEQLLQWNLDQTLTVGKFRFTGSFDQNNDADYDRLLKDFARDSSCAAKLGFMGTPSTPMTVEMHQLSTAVKSMTFFDRLEEYDIVHGGHIRGCFEEIYEGISVSDKLRDMLVNEDSENASVYSEGEKKELIFVIFRILVIGGSMCQPDTEVKRYQELTKSLYKELLTVYKMPSTGEVAISGRCFQVLSVGGVDLFSNPEKDQQNVLVLVVDPMKKEVTSLKVNFVSFW